MVHTASVNSTFDRMQGVTELEPRQIELLVLWSRVENCEGGCSIESLLFQGGDDRVGSRLRNDTGLCCDCVDGPQIEEVLSWTPTAVSAGSRGLAVQPSHSVNVRQDLLQTSGIIRSVESCSIVCQLGQAVNRLPMAKHSTIEGPKSCIGSSVPISAVTVKVMGEGWQRNVNGKSLDT